MKGVMIQRGDVWRTQEDGDVITITIDNITIADLWNNNKFEAIVDFTHQVNDKPPKPMTGFVDTFNNWFAATRWDKVQ